MSAVLTKILFVDDEPKVLSGIIRLLRKERFVWDIETANSVDEAIKLLAQDDFDLVVSDFNMPERDGLDLISEMRLNSNYADIPVIMLTGNAEVDLKRRALDAGAIDLLSKPVSQEDLLARLRSVLQLRECQKKILEANAVLECRVALRTQELERSRNEVLWRLAYAVEARDNETGAHIARVARFSKVIAEEYGLSAEKVNQIYFASPLHDVGKIAVPDSILHKPGKLSGAERQVIEGHCTIGWDILMRPMMINDQGQDKNLLIECAAEIALSHHEKWDGSGYPKGISGHDIPVSARIVAVADVLDALCATRSYKSGIPFDKSFKMICQMSRNHFDPEIIEACLRCKDQLQDILLGIDKIDPDWDIDVRRIAS